MCLLWSTNWGFISQKTTFFIVTTVKTSNLAEPLPIEILGIPIRSSIRFVSGYTNREFIMPGCVTQSE
jgi:hypothetical protein